MHYAATDLVVLVDVFGSGAVATQQNTGAPDVFDLVVGDFVLLRVQVHTNGTTAAVRKAVNRLPPTIAATLPVSGSNRNTVD